ncbi:hypothetical protein ETAA8_67510 [Anatilimnocola aggregata]|uniref:Uncharacterized protein n=1 Tax=Anatilimnocola aggregata TaxID=2528021 RepID=A0A517YN04_9BACT|nr:hypothetical protein [Anatilimnocola aggregata]QDU31591.1 hypothetical protein ETAA8_67510 [Anatilimnocola aggregata]
MKLLHVTRCWAVIAGLALAVTAQAQEQTLSETGVIAGTMEIDFKTRTELDTAGTYADGSSALGAKDTYILKLTVAKTTEFSGKITRQPDLFTKIIRSQKQKAELGFDINLAVRNPRNLDERRNVGKWVGTVPINTATGAFEISGGASLESPLRIAIDAIGQQPAFTDKFGGKLIGKSKKDEGLASYTYKRLVGNKTFEIKVAKIDPMKFVDLELAKGPAGNYPRTVVNGRLDFDYETGNWLTDGIRFRYNFNGKEVEDIVTGSVKWVEDENRKTNGKGEYQFNLRWNEAKQAKDTTEAAAFDKLSDEDAFFAVDDSLPCLTGKISYEDKFISGEETPASSKVTYALNSNKLTKTQIVNFFKLWLIGTGPINDE